MAVLQSGLSFLRNSCHFTSHTRNNVEIPILSWKFDISLIILHQNLSFCEYNSLFTGKMSFYKLSF